MRLAGGWALLALSAAVAGGAEPPAVERSRFGASELLAVPLDGVLVSALAMPERRELLLLVRPVAEVDGPRRLLRVALDGEPRVETLVPELGGWSQRLAAIELGGADDDRLELAAAGLGRLDALGPIAAPRAAGRTLIDHPGFDLRALDPERLRVGSDRELIGVEVGHLRVWSPDGAGGLVLAAEHDLPFEAERTETGLRLTGTRLLALPPRAGGGGLRFAVGPETIGAARLRLRVLERTGDGWSEQDSWLALPAPERLEQTWWVELDGEPALVARAQDAVVLDVFERQRWRAWRLGVDRTRAGRPPILAVAVDSKRWHDGAVAVADVDGDGRDDLIVARPEGLSGSDLVLEVRRGRTDGRLDARARRRDLEGAGSTWRLGDARHGGGEPSLAVLRRDQLELWRFAARGRRPLGDAPALAVTIGEPPWAAGGLGLLGTWAPEPAAPPWLVAAAADAEGGERLLVVRSAGR